MEAADRGQEPPKLPAPRAGQATIHVAVEAGLVDLVVLLGKAREETHNLLVERRAVLSSVQTHIYGGVPLVSSTGRGVRGSHAKRVAVACDCIDEHVARVAPPGCSGLAVRDRWLAAWCCSRNVSCVRQLTFLTNSSASATRTLKGPR